MTFYRALTTLLLIAIVAGCSAAADPTATVAPTRVEVRLTDEMRIDPAEMTVPAAVPVTFVVTNVGVIDHEFYLGDADAQAHHEEEMASSAMAHDDPSGITVEPGQTQELTYTFEPQPAQTLAGCHIPGHYPAGMKATITVMAEPE
jgi:uncharacterized cupredoxin-like copper-binding protein